MRVAIVGLGPSAMSFVRMVEGLGDPKRMFDEIWAVNGFSNVLKSDRGFAMDDVRVQEARAKGGNKKIQHLLASYKRHSGPIYTSRTHPDYPALVDYPLEAVLNSSPGRAYFNSTIAYAIALAIHEKVESIGMFGADYTFKDLHIAEKGRGCCEYWLGVAEARGIKVGVTNDSSMLDSDCGEEIYGYDTQKVLKGYDEQGWCKISFKDKEMPTAAEIERRYDKTGKHQEEVAVAA